MDKANAGMEVSDQIDLGMCLENGTAVGGYDLVSYHQEGGPVPGIEEFAADHAGSRYLFSSQTNLDTFVATPDIYVPAYSGFCAITLALGRVTCPEYTNFKIENHQLLLFEVTGFTNGRTVWNSDAASYRQQADTNYGRLIDSQ